MIKKGFIYYSMFSLVITFAFILYYVFRMENLIDIIKYPLIIIMGLMFAKTSKLSLTIYSHYFIKKEEQYILSRKEIQEKYKNKKYPLKDKIIGFTIFLCIFLSSLLVLFHTYLTYTHLNIFTPGALFCAFWFLRDIIIIGYKTL